MTPHPVLFIKSLKLFRILTDFHVESQPGEFRRTIGSTATPDPWGSWRPLRAADWPQNGVETGRGTRD
jgi:hypothetical protein